MASRESRISKELIHDIEYLDDLYTVVPQNTCYMVSAKAGGEVVPVPFRLDQRTFKSKLDQLRRSLGYDPDEANRRRAAEHEEKVREARLREAAMLREAQERAKANEAAQVALRQARLEQEAAEAQAAAKAAKDAEFDRKRESDRLAGKAKEVGTVRFDSIDVDQQFAAALLRHNNWWVPGDSSDDNVRRNRPQSPSKVREFAQAMLDDEWQRIHQGIALDWDGNLIDGQTRLAAVCQAATVRPDIKVPFIISYDWNPEVFALVDQNRIRSGADVLAIDGFDKRPSLASTVRLVMQYYADPGPAFHMKVTKKALLDFARANRKALIAALDQAADVNEAVSLVESATAAAIFICRQEYPGGPHDEFLHGLITGGDAHGRVLPEGDPRQALIRTLRRERRDYRNAGVRVEHLAWYIKAWTKYVQGDRDVRLIMYKPKIEVYFPEPPTGPAR